MYSYSGVYSLILSYRKQSYMFKHKYDLTYISKQAKTIFVKGINWSKSTNLFVNSWKKILRQFFSLNYIKMRFKGKGYKLYFKKFRTIYLRFGFSHKNYHYNINNFSRYFVKWVLLYRVIFLGYNWRSLRFAILSLVKRRFINIFTFRGMKLVRQLTTRKTGKISTYF